jgi:hypothetical protein
MDRRMIDLERPPVQLMHAAFPPELTCCAPKSPQKTPRGSEKSHSGVTKRVVDCLNRRNRRGVCLIRSLGGSI